MSTESALTAPSDRNPDKSYLKQLESSQDAPPLTAEELVEAKEELNVTDFIKKYRAVERRFVDSAVDHQRIGLVSFVPAKGATPNEAGVYGFAKLRGNYSSELEANARAASLIKNEDSYHQIYHVYVGRPFPCTNLRKFSKETDEVDLNKQTSESVSAVVKSQRDEEQKQVQEIHQREAELKRDTAPDKEVDPMDQYITLRVKKAQLTWTYMEHAKKMEEVKEILIRTRAEVAALEEKSATYKEQYLEKYRDARQRAGIKQSPEEEAQNFMKFMVEEGELPF